MIDTEPSFPLALRDKYQSRLCHFIQHDLDGLGAPARFPSDPRGMTGTPLKQQPGEDLGAGIDPEERTHLKEKSLRLLRIRSVAQRAQFESGFAEPFAQVRRRGLPGSERQKFHRAAGCPFDEIAIHRLEQSRFTEVRAEMHRFELLGTHEPAVHRQPI